MKIIIAGGSGFIGSALAAHFVLQGHEVISLSRRTNWDPDGGKIDQNLLEGAEVMINLVGETLLGRWTQKKMARIRSSRLVPTAFLTESLLHLHNPPKLYIGASGVGYYGDRGEEELTEASSLGSGFIAELCHDWEAIPQRLVSAGCRVVAARFGIVLGKQGGVLGKLIPPFRLGLGGMMGNGQQIISWIALDDLVGAMDHVIKNGQVSGPINFVSPHPVTNRQLTKILGKILHRPTFFRLPFWLLHLVFGPGASNFVASAYVRPQKLLETGYPFQYSDIEVLLKKLFANKTPGW